MNVEWVMVWVTIAGIIVLPIAGAILRDLLLKKLDELGTQQKVDRELFFKKLDEQKEIYVRKDIYEQAHKFIKDDADSKYNTLCDKLSDLKELVKEQGCNNKNCANFKGAKE